MRLLTLASLVLYAAAYDLPVRTHHRGARAVIPRTRAASMKGKGSRGMPGKASQGRAPKGMNGNIKSRLEKQDFNRAEWTLVAGKEELGPNLGDTLAVEAGQSPQGTNYIWTLIRGDDGVGEGSTVWATDGSCRACTFPNTKATVSTDEDGGYSMDCATCGSVFSLTDGKPSKWLPGEGPAQFIAKQLNKDKEPLGASLLMTRVSKAGRIYVRLPDGTLKITETAAERAEKLAGGLKIGEA